MASAVAGRGWLADRRRGPALGLVSDGVVAAVIAQRGGSAGPRTAAQIAALVRRYCRAHDLPVPPPAAIRRRLAEAQPGPGRAGPRRAVLGRAGARQGPQPASVETPDVRADGTRTAAAPGRFLFLADRTPDRDSALIDLLYGTVAQPDGWQPFLDAFTRSYGGGHGVFGMHDTALHAGWLQHGSGWDPQDLAAYNTHYASSNPWIPAMSNLPVGSLAVADAMAPRAELLKTEFYNDLLRRYGVDDAIGVAMQRDGSRIMIVSVVFPHATAERDPDVAGRLKRLVPHLLRVAQLNRQFASLSARASAADGGLEHLSSAMLVVTQGGRVMHMNGAAERIAVRGDGLSIRGKALVATDHQEASALRTLIADALKAPRARGTLPGGVMRVTRPSGGAPYEVLVAPMHEQTLALAVGGPMAVVFIRDPDLRGVAPRERLQRLYALTGAEARLMHGLLAGDTLDAIAAKEGVTKETLRSQLKAVFLKTGTASQLELVRLGLRGLGAFA